MKRVFAWALALCLTAGLLVVPARAADSATIQATIQALGIMTGDENGNMNLSAPVTRAQFAKMMVMASSYRDTVGESGGMSVFSDVKSSYWGAEYIRIAVEQGWVQGYSDGTFRPDKTITTEEAATALLRMLGYISEDLAGTYPQAQLSKYRALGLGDGVSAGQGQALTREEVMVIFYNLMTAKTKAGSVYATTIGYSLTASGELDYTALVEENLVGPITRLPGESLEISFTPTAVYRNGAEAQLSDIGTYDVYYYNENLRTVYAYSNRVVGTYTAASPGVMSPTSVTVAGNTYSLSTSSAIYKLSSMGEFSVGDQVTLLLGMDGTVVDVVSAAVGSEIVYGVVIGTSTEKYTDAAGGSHTSRTVEVACTDGTVRQYSTDVSYDVGAMVSVSSNGGSLTVKRLTDKSAGGKVNSDGTRIGDLTLAADVEILDSDGNGGYKRVYPSRLAGYTLSSGDVQWYITNDSGQVTHMILDDVTGDIHTYGLLTDVQEVSQEMNLIGSYTYLINGQSGVFNSSGTLFSVSTGGARFVYEDGAISSIKNLEKVTLTSLTASQASASNGKTYKVSEDVQVYLRSGTSSSSYSLTNLAALGDLSQYQVTGYYDDLGCSAGGQIRVVTAVKK